MLVAQPPEDNSGATGEMLHIIRPLLDLACGADEPCVFVEVGNFCGASLALALTHPRLKLAVNVGATPLRERGCIDMTTASDEFLIGTREDLLDKTPPKLEGSMYRIWSGSTRSMYWLDARDVTSNFDEALKQRLQCLQPKAEVRLATSTPALQQQLESRNVSVLLIGVQSNRTKARDVIRDFEQLSPHVGLGGIVMLDEYMTNPEVKLAVDGTARVQAVGPKGLAAPRGKLVGLIQTACTSNFHCIGPLANFARAQTKLRVEAETKQKAAASAPTVPRFNQVFIMQRVAVGRPLRREQVGTSGSANAEDSPDSAEEALIVTATF